MYEVSGPFAFGFAVVKPHGAMLETSEPRNTPVINLRAESVATRLLFLRRGHASLSDTSTDTGNAHWPH